MPDISGVADGGKAHLTNCAKELLALPAETGSTYFEAASFLEAVPVLVGISSATRAFFTWK
jgi:hypothetical protein